MDTNQGDLSFLRLLAEQFPSIQAASTAIIRLTAQLNLPKGTEHFVSDVHGEYEAFRHVLRNGSGSIRRRIDELFGDTLSDRQRRNLATLVYYPQQKLPLILSTVDDPAGWFRTTLQRLIALCRIVSSKYPRTTMERFLPEGLAPVIEELLSEQESIENRSDYYYGIVESIIATGSAPAFVIALAELIQRLAIARLHVIGDIFDRGPGAHFILDTLMAYHSVDVQWGNHDALWMGAAAGSPACIANVIRICLRYGNLDTLETGYGISLLPLASLAINGYGEDPCRLFLPPEDADSPQSAPERRLVAQMHKAITIIQLKLEGQIVLRRPQYQMQDRLLLDKIDAGNSTIRLDGVVHPLLDARLPTVDPQQPYELTVQEKSVMEKLALFFLNSQRLQNHVRFLFARGSLYRVHNGNLLFHGCIPMHEDGSFTTFEVDGQPYGVRAYMDRLESLARQGYFAAGYPDRKQDGMDTLWYLWCGAHSPLFGKKKIATFERYFLAAPETHVEQQNAYYAFRDRKSVACKILQEFGLDPDTGHIINGHVPVQVRRGESPVKAGGKLLVIDGGFSRAYQKKTGIAGYTLVSNSWGFLLAQHQPFESSQKAIEEEIDIDSTTTILEQNTTRIRVRDTDLGREIEQRIGDLNALLDAYRTGILEESETDPMAAVRQAAGIG